MSKTILSFSPEQRIPTYPCVLQFLADQTVEPLAVVASGPNVQDSGFILSCTTNSGVVREGLVAQSAICGEFRDRRSWTLPLPCRSFGGRADQSASQLRDKGRFGQTTIHTSETLHISSFSDQSGTLRAG